MSDMNRMLMIAGVASLLKVLIMSMVVVDDDFGADDELIE